MKHGPNLSKASLGIRSNNNYIFTSNLFSSENQGLNKKITGLLDYYILPYIGFFSFKYVLRIYWSFLSNSLFLKICYQISLSCPFIWMSTAT